MSATISPPPFQTIRVTGSFPIHTYCTMFALVQYFYFMRRGGFSEKSNLLLYSQYNAKTCNEFAELIFTLLRQ